MKWKDDAACRNSGVDFFPVLESTRGGRRSNRRELQEEYDAKVAAAVALCEQCPVRRECGEYAMNEDDGIWAGVVHMPRQQRANRKKAAADRERRLRERESA